MSTYLKHIEPWHNCETLNLAKHDRRTAHGSPILLDIQTWSKRFAVSATVPAQFARRVLVSAVNEIVMAHETPWNRRGCRRIVKLLLAHWSEQTPKTLTICDHWSHYRRGTCVFKCRRITVIGLWMQQFTQKCSHHLLKIHQIHILQTWIHHGSRVHWRELELPALVFLLLRVQWCRCLMIKKRQCRASNLHDVWNALGHFQIHWKQK